jgi:hypothetical protein
MLSEVFWIAFIATASALCMKGLTLCYKSKCKEVTLCGGRINCVRDTEAEVAQDQIVARPSSPRAADDSL